MNKTFTIGPGSPMGPDSPFCPRSPIKEGKYLILPLSGQLSLHKIWGAEKLD
jgi:hypothetical protein